MLDTQYVKFDRHDFISLVESSISGGADDTKFGYHRVSVESLLENAQDYRPPTCAGDVPVSLILPIELYVRKDWTSSPVSTNLIYQVDGAIAFHNMDNHDNPLLVNRDDGSESPEVWISYRNYV